jgi:WD40 repeat protein
MIRQFWKKHTRTVRSCAWSPSGKLLATPSFDDTTATWEINGGDFECVAALEVFQLIKKCWLLLPFLSLIKSSHARTDLSLLRVMKMK